MTLIGNFPATSSQKTQVSGSTVYTFDPIPFAVHSHDITNIGTAVGNSQRLLWVAADSRTTPQKVAFPEPFANYVVRGRFKLPTLRCRAADHIAGCRRSRRLPGMPLGNRRNIVNLIANAGSNATLKRCGFTNIPTSRRRYRI